MSRVILDHATLTKLHNLTQPLELCDESGTVRARLTPVPDSSDFELSEPPIEEAELRRREQSDKWHTTEEVLAHLRKLGA